MSDEGLQVLCPFCGGPSHRLTQVDGCIWNYICSRCHKVFKVDEATGLVVDQDTAEKDMRLSRLAMESKAGEFLFEEQE